MCGWRGVMPSTARTDRRKKAHPTNRSGWKSPLSRCETGCAKKGSPTNRSGWKSPLSRCETGCAKKGSPD